MKVRFVENSDGTVAVQGRIEGHKWNKNRKPIRVIKSTPGWRERLLRWAQLQGHEVVGQ